MSGNGHVKRRRGILGHLQDGRITLLEEGAHDVISMLANKASGIWFGSARAFAANCGAGDVSERQGRHLLESLEQKGYIRRFTTPRAHGNYPILINKYEVTFGAQSGMRLNAVTSIDWRKPVYELRPEHGAEEGAERAPYQEERREKAAAASGNAEPWKAIGLNHPIGDKAFREFWETTWATRNGHRLSEVMGGCADAWQAGGGKVPASFFRELARIRAEEKLDPIGRPAGIVKLEANY
jgi:hypothetical protein